jgi:hypothetical protein
VKELVLIPDESISPNPSTCNIAACFAQLIQFAHNFQSQMKYLIPQSALIL